MTSETIKTAIMSIVDEYAVSKVILFGSRANGKNREDSDIDLVVEFSEPVSLLTLSNMKIHLEEILGKDVDIIHGPIQETDLLDIGKTEVLYAA